MPILSYIGTLQGDIKAITHLGSERFSKCLKDGEEIGIFPMATIRLK